MVQAAEVGLCRGRGGKCECGTGTMSEAPAQPAGSVLAGMLVCFLRSSPVLLPAPTTVELRPTLRHAHAAVLASVMTTDVPSCPQRLARACIKPECRPASEGCSAAAGAAACSARTARQDGRDRSWGVLSIFLAVQLLHNAVTRVQCTALLATCKLTGVHAKCNPLLLNQEQLRACCLHSVRCMCIMHAPRVAVCSSTARTCSLPSAMTKKATSARQTGQAGCCCVPTHCSMQQRQNL